MIRSGSAASRASSAGADGSLIGARNQAYAVSFGQRQQ